MFAHDWSANYTVTFSFKTDIITSRSGKEQRRACRQEPRRAMQTRATVGTRDARDFDRWLWNTGSTAFVYTEPRGGGTPSVRLAETVSVNHLTSGATQADVTLSVDPGTEVFSDPVIDASFSYGLRLAFPLNVNWSANVGDTISLPRETVDFDVGRIAVFNPVASNTRMQQASTLLYDDTLSDFFRYQHGRAGDFWVVSPLGDMAVINQVSNRLTVEGDMRPIDGVDCAVRVELRTGGRYFRRVASYDYVLGNTTLVLDTDVPDTVNRNTVRRCSWVRLARFASDDLTVQWVTEDVGQASITTQTLPYAVVENALPFDDGTQYFVDYLGWPDWLDPLDYIVNVQMARIGGDVTTRDWYQATLDYIVNRQMPRVGVL